MSRQMLKDARHSYFVRVNCYIVAFKYLDKDKYQCVEDIQRYIPEFNRTYLNAEKWASNYGQWWDVWDRESRIKAFDKLIKIYK